MVQRQQFKSIQEVGNSLEAYINQNQGSAQSSILPQSSITKKPFTFVVKEMERVLIMHLIKQVMKGHCYNKT